MKRNFTELFSKMKPAAQERVKARSGELLNEISLMEIEGAITADDVRTPSADANSLSSEESLPQRR